MSFIDNDNSNGFYMPVSPAYGSNNGGWGNGFGGDGAWWLLVLILAMNGGWGNGFGAGAGGAMPYTLNNSTSRNERLRLVRSCGVSVAPPFLLRGVNQNGT